MAQTPSRTPLCRFKELTTHPSTPILSHTFSNFHTIPNRNPSVPHNPLWSGDLSITLKPGAMKNRAGVTLYFIERAASKKAVQQELARVFLMGYGDKISGTKRTSAQKKKKAAKAKARRLRRQGGLSLNKYNMFLSPDILGREKREMETWLRKNTPCTKEPKNEGRVAEWLKYEFETMPEMQRYGLMPRPEALREKWLAFLERGEEKKKKRNRYNMFLAAGENTARERGEMECWLRENIPRL